MRVGIPHTYQDSLEGEYLQYIIRRNKSAVKWYSLDGESTCLMTGGTGSSPVTTAKKEEK